MAGLTGAHVLFGMTGAFGLIIGVNVVLATQAVRTFPGLEVANSYVASQSFDVDRAAQEALGWDVSAAVHGSDLVLSIRDARGRPVAPETLSATFGRATSTRDDQAPDFVFDGSVHRAAVAAGPGNWNLRMAATAADGTEFHRRIVVLVD